MSQWAPRVLSGDTAKRVLVSTAFSCSWGFSAHVHVATEVITVPGTCLQGAWSLGTKFKLKRLAEAFEFELLGPGSTRGS